jgi:flagellar biosynthesis protein FlhB
MEKRFPGSARHIKKLRENGTTVESAQFLGSVSVVLVGVLSWSSHRWICSPVVSIATQCWGGGAQALDSCLRNILTEDWGGIGMIFAGCSVVSCLLMVAIKRPRLQLDRVAPSMSRLTPTAWIGRLRRLPLQLIGSLSALSLGFLVSWWIAGDFIQRGFFSLSDTGVHALLFRSSVGIGLFLALVGAASFSTGWWRFRWQTMMTGQEVRQEQRDECGDPLVRGQQRGLHRAMLREDLVRAVKRSSVVIVARANCVR